MDGPRHTTTTVTRHEWVIGREDGATDAKTFTYGINQAQREMKELGVDLAFDDCYRVRAGDGGQVILFVEVEE